MASKAKLPSNSEFLHNYLPISAFRLSMPKPRKKMFKIIKAQQKRIQK